MYWPVDEKTEWISLSMLQFTWKVCFYWWSLFTDCYVYFVSLDHSVRRPTTSVCREQGMTWDYLNPSWPSATTPYSVNSIHKVGKPCFDSSNNFQNCSTILLPFLKSYTTLSHQYQSSHYTLRRFLPCFSPNSCSCYAPPCNYHFFG